MTPEVLDALVLAAFAALLGLVVVLLVRGSAALDVQEVRRRVRCPVRGASADCLLIRDVRTGRWTGVARCSLLPAGRRCNQACVRLLEAGADLTPRRAGSASE